MSNTLADRNMLFGILALQLDFIAREDLIAAMHAWVLAKSKSLGEILGEQGKLVPDRLQLLEALVAEHIKQHADDAEKSLASVSTIGSVREDLKRIGDGDIAATLAYVSMARKDDNPCEMLPSTMGQSTSAGTRFRILRPYAKGGLGQVSVALDDELHREVALKELQDHHADNPQSRARFTVEAEITGGLEHPGIVPVYGLGQYADGRPFYAMRFIRGDSLKDAIERFHEKDSAAASWRDTGERTLELRKLLGRFIDVCNAIEYAHSRGVLHRDLKPGNIMLGKYGETLVVDWGLAKTVERPDQHASSDELTLRPSSGSGSAPTLAGQVIGTPAFMSPEQAAGRLEELGPRSDVYSLGATLYSLLTGQPPISDTDLVTILRKVKRGDFARPCAIKVDVPLPLDAICLKAMALNAEDRYATPIELASDVEHYLADEPVTCYCEPPLVRARRWAKRHPRLVTGTGATLLVGLVSLVAIGSILSQSNRALSVKNQELKQANQRERAAAELAHNNEQTAREQTQLALKSLQSVIFDIQRGLQTVAGAGAVRRKLLQDALARLEEVSDQFAARSAIDRNTVAALHALGDVFLRIGTGDEGRDVDGPLTAARKLYRRAMDISQRLSEFDPLNALVQRDLAISYYKLGDVQLQSAQVAEALRSYQRCLEIRQKLTTADPGDAGLQISLSSTYTRLGDVQLRSSQVTEALSSYEKGLEINKKLVATDPSNALAHRDLSVSYNRIGDMQLQSGQVTEALGLYQKGLEIRQKLAVADPSDAEAQADLSTAYDRLGDVQLRAGQVTEALGSYQKGLDISRSLAAADPNDAQAQSSLSAATIRLGDVQLRSGQVTEALRSYENGLEINKKLAAGDPSDATAQRGLSVSFSRLGNVQLQFGQVTEALGSYQKSLEITQKLAATNPSDATAQRSLTIDYNKLGDVQLQSGQVTNALGSYQKGLEVSRSLAAADPNDAQAQRDLSVSYKRLGDVQLQLGQLTEALESYQSCLELCQKLARADPDDADRQISLSSTYIVLGDVQLRFGQVTEALGLYQKGVEICQKLAAGDPSDARTQYNLYVVMAKTGSAHRKAQQFETAISWYQQALEILNRLEQSKRLAPSQTGSIAFMQRCIKECQLAPIALGDWEKLLAQPASSLPTLLELRGLVSVHRGHVADAVQAVAKLRVLGTGTADQLYNAACIYSLCAASIKPEKDELTAEQVAKRQQHIADALDTLREAIAAGLKDFAYMQTDPDLAPLRDLPEFKALPPGSAGKP